jgi:3-phenylpropionate/trans-cinnamate dioxygenase ferredoxin subunit
MNQDYEKFSFYQVILLEDLPKGERIFIELDGEPIVIFNIAGDIYAIGDRCTHDDGPLGEGELEDHTIICPRHGAKFDVRTGDALTLPAVEPTTNYPIQVVDGMIEIGLINNN